MRRLSLLGAVVLFILSSMVVAWICHSIIPERIPLVAAGQPAKPEASPSLPLSQVVLFSSGVGYFQREGEIEGNARVDLQFPIGDVNDLLKSLVLQDLGEGKIGAVSYDGPEPVDKMLRGFAIDLAGNPTVGELLNQARGEKVEVVLLATAVNQPGTLSGVILGMEAQNQTGSAGSMQELHFLNLLCAEGVRSVNLRDVARVRFLNPRLESELRKALEVLAAAHDSLKKQVSLNFQGEGKRKVRVGYVAENPVWKTSYRLSVDDAKAAGGEPRTRARLQGWAALENVTDDDWNDVRVVLVSGRPISFQMDLYPPVYVPRPTLEPERFASLRPPGYSGALTRDKVENLPVNRATPGSFLGIGGVGGFGGIGGLGGLGGSGLAGGLGGGGMSNQLPPGPPPNRYQGTRTINPVRANEDDEDRPGSRISYAQWQARRGARQDSRDVGERLASLDPHGRLLAEAAMEDLGGHVRYVIEQKVSLPRQKSVLLPLLDKSIEATRVCIFNESVHAAFPVLGLRVKNNSGKPLVQGPITVYEDGNYSGDAQLPDLQPGEERLLSYAVDLGVEVKAKPHSSRGPALLATLAGDELQVQYTARETREYTVRNRTAQDRVLVIEHPVREGWTLAAGIRPRETSRSHYRFDVPIKAGQTVQFDVAEEQTAVDKTSGRWVLDKDGRPLSFYRSDLGLVVKLTTREAPAELLRASIVGGEVRAFYKQRTEQSYQVLNEPGQEARQITLRHRVGDDWRIAETGNAKAVQSKDAVLQLAGGGDGRVEFAAEREKLDSWRVATTQPQAFEKLLRQPRLPDGVRKALQKVLDLRVAVDGHSRKIAELEKRVKEITDDQSRLRQNLANLPATSAAYKRYVEKFDKQESDFEHLQEQIRQEKDGEQRGQKELTDYLAELNAF
jgi:hypothetical protein